MQACARSGWRCEETGVIPGWSEGPDPESRDSGFASRPGTTATLRHCHLPRLLRARHRKAFIALGCDVVADQAIRTDAADVGHENPRLARDVGAHVPGVGLRIE